MEKVILGATGLKVSRLCLGTAPMGPHQRNISPAEGGQILKRAFDLGVDFWDTSDDYGTHSYVREGLRGLDRSQVIITTKTHARHVDEARSSLVASLEELGTDYVDFYLLHAVDSLEDFDSRMPALEGALKAREEGLCRVVGISTHSVKVAQRIPQFPELEYALLLCNTNKTRLLDGTWDEQNEAIRQSFFAGKGICLIKVLGAGSLVPDYQSAMSYALDFPYGHCIMVGVKSMEEMEVAVRFIDCREYDEEIASKLKAGEIDYDYAKILARSGC